MQRCLLDCEHWIRLRGLPKKTKSRKVRLLHHCYVYLRIFQASTSVSEDLSSPRNGFRSSQWEGRLEQRMNEIKEAVMGENDLHLEIPGRWDCTMYPSIFGVPESFLFLLSQVTRLANERDLAEAGHSSGGNYLDFKEFMSRARSLESCICASHVSFSATQGEDRQRQTRERSTSSNDNLINFMLNALHKALMIFFYRRIYEIDASMLQNQVYEVRKSLEECSRFDEPAVGIAASFVWPAFIAACEAQDLDTRDWFVKWFNQAAEKSELQTCRLAKETIQDVWRRSSCLSTSRTNDANWPQIMREGNQSMFYV